MSKGSCHCGAVRFSIDSELTHSSVCHCEDCRRTTGALTTGWLGFPSEGLDVTGETKVYESSEGVMRHFCPECGTSLFYYNEALLPGTVDILTSTMDEPESYPPQLHVQLADALSWEATLDGLPKFERYPG